jgi:hypothetical protein
VRTALGVAAVAFCVVLTAAGANTEIARLLDARVEDVNVVLQVLVGVGPVTAGLLAWRICRALD